jgi:hypothetical protein
LGNWGDQIMKGAMVLSGARRNKQNTIKRERILIF